VSTPWSESFAVRSACESLESLGDSTAFDDKRPLREFTNLKLDTLRGQAMARAA
jgi:hypothetical protein